MKRVKAACILQTLVFSQKPDCGLTREQQLKINRSEVNHYKATMDRSRTRYQITEETEQADGSVLVPEVLRPYMGGKERLIPLH